MAYYNTSNLTNADTVVGVAQEMNALTNNALGMYIVFGLVAVIFLALSTRYRFETSLLISTTMGAIVGGFMTAINLFPTYLWLTLTIISIFLIGASLLRR